MNEMNEIELLVFEKHISVTMGRFDKRLLTGCLQSRRDEVIKIATERGWKLNEEESSIFPLNLPSIRKQYEERDYSELFDEVSDM